MNEIVWKNTVDINLMNKTLLFLEKAAQRENIDYKSFNYSLDEIKNKRDRDLKYVYKWFDCNRIFFNEDTDKVRGVKYNIDDTYLYSVFFLFYDYNDKWTTIGRVCLLNHVAVPIVWVALSKMDKKPILGLEKKAYPVN